MIKIIDGVRYDTDKAIEIGSASYSNSGDFHHWDETLYKSPRSGRFFIAGSGGPMSKYSRQIEQNSWSGGSRIIPINADQAREWCEQYLEGDEWAQHFPADSIEDA
jgi:hypothetical protein